MPKTQKSASLSAAFLHFYAIILFCLFAASAPALATPLDFTTFRLGNSPETVLVVGGIQGDEPGGFSAANLIATRYEITKGSVQVVPNLNFPSIIKRSRGLHGDMNRKFDLLDANDPEFATVRRIQDMISAPDVKLVLNLHDGSGYFRPVHEDKLRNPRRWGQSIIIDQESLADGIFMGNLARHADAVAKAANKKLIKPIHALHVHNTNTAAGDREMEKSLSYFAAKKNKAAFGLEASKELSVAVRTYYHLLMIEEFLKQAGVEFERDFELTPRGVEKALAERLGVSFAENRIFLPLEDARPSINLLPLPRNANIITSKPIMAVLPCEKQPGHLCVHYGNRMLAFIRPDWRDVNEELDCVAVKIDGQERMAAFGQTIDIGKDLYIHPIPGFRVNAIGYDKGEKDESGQNLRKQDFDARYSLDRAGSIFRIEIYKGKSFAGMFLARFSAPGQTANRKTPLLPDKKGPESELGF